MERFITLATIASFSFAVLIPCSADARKRVEEPAIAVWRVLADDLDQGTAGPVYAEIADAIESVDGARTDWELAFMPRVRPAEGVVVAQRTAARWLDAAWLAYQRREWAVAQALVDDALLLVEPYPHERLPDGLCKELYLLKARTHVRGGSEFEAREALRQAMVLDPAWEAMSRWEHPDLVAMYEGVREETIGVPPARLTITVSEPGATILVGGIERGRSDGESTELLLPPGNHEVTARLAGHASHTQKLFLVPRQELDAEFFLEVRNTARFQEQLAGALREPASQRHSGIWTALDLALGNVSASAVLTASYDGDAEVLHVGLFYPRRQGWAFYRSLELGGSDRRGEVDAAIEDLLLTVDSILHPKLIDEVASR